MVFWISPKLDFSSLACSSMAYSLIEPTSGFCLELVVNDEALPVFAGNAEARFVK